MSFESRLSKVLFEMDNKVRVFAADDSGNVKQSLPDVNSRMAWLQASPRNALVFSNGQGRQAILASQGDDATYYLAYHPQADPDDVIAGDIQLTHLGMLNRVFTAAANALSK